MENNLEKGKMTREYELEIPELLGEDLKLGELSYYELTEAVHQFHMRKQ
jgi:hypothetical protein